jgi:hypothetical protein
MEATNLSPPAPERLDVTLRRSGTDQTGPILVLVQPLGGADKHLPSALFIVRAGCAPDLIDDPRLASCMRGRRAIVLAFEDRADAEAVDAHIRAARRAISQ